MKAIAPGKVILSGEHAVVYGRPALVAAVARYAAVTAAPGAGGGLLDIQSPFGETRLRDEAELAARNQAARDRYAAFLDDRLPIADVLPDKHGLVELAWEGLRRQRPDSMPPAGLRVTITSDLPVGAGMGSSAAVAAALVTVLAAWFDLALTPDERFELCLDLERYQHGRPSGVDPFVAVHGGLVRYRRGEPPATLPTAPASFRLAHTGIPACSTGECVYQVRSTHAHSAIWDEFETVCGDVERALRAEDEAALIEAVRLNHHLLTEIGVVPRRIGEVVARIEQAGGAAKICGAGAVRGDAGGVLWVVGPAALPDGAGEELIVAGELRGARLDE